MKVRVSEAFHGQFGVYDPKSKRVERKTSEDGPFDIREEDGKRLTEKGILIPVPQETEKKKARKPQKFEGDPMEDDLK